MQNEIKLDMLSSQKVIRKLIKSMYGNLMKLLYGVCQAGHEWFNEKDKTFKNVKFDEELDCNGVQ